MSLAIFPHVDLINEALIVNRHTYSQDSMSKLNYIEMENTRFAVACHNKYGFDDNDDSEDHKEKERIFFCTSKLINCEEIVARDATMSYGCFLNSIHCLFTIMGGTAKN